MHFVHDPYTRTNETCIHIFEILRQTLSHDNEVITSSAQNDCALWILKKCHLASSESWTMCLHCQESLSHMPWQGYDCQTVRFYSYSMIVLQNEIWTETHRKIIHPDFLASLNRKKIRMKWLIDCFMWFVFENMLLTRLWRYTFSNCCNNTAIIYWWIN